MYERVTDGEGKSRKGTHPLLLCNSLTSLEGKKEKEKVFCTVVESSQKRGGTIIRKKSTCAPATIIWQWRSKRRRESISPDREGGETPEEERRTFNRHPSVQSSSGEAGHVRARTTRGKQEGTSSSGVEGEEERRRSDLSSTLKNARRAQLKPREGIGCMGKGKHCRGKQNYFFITVSYGRKEGKRKIAYLLMNPSFFEGKGRPPGNCRPRNVCAYSPTRGVTGRASALLSLREERRPALPHALGMVEKRTATLGGERLASLSLNGKGKGWPSPTIICREEEMTLGKNDVWRFIHPFRRMRGKKKKGRCRPFSRSICRSWEGCWGNAVGAACFYRAHDA